jgi:uncharacterized protein YbcI
MELCENNNRSMSLIEKQIANNLAKFVKEKIGKGPGDTTVKIVDGFAVCCFQNFMTKAEMLIVESGHPEKVLENRHLYKKQCLGEIETVFMHALNKRIKYFFDNYRLEENVAYWTIILD